MKSQLHVEPTYGEHSVYTLIWHLQSELEIGQAKTVTRLDAKNRLCKQILYWEIRTKFFIFDVLFFYNRPLRTEIRKT